MAKKQSAGNRDTVPIKRNGDSAEEQPPLRLEWIDATQLQENPANWRRHPEKQLSALKDVIAEVGWAGACLLNERTGRLIDGHARKKVAEGRVPVLIGSWTEDQERKILATLDPLAAMAEADKGALDALLRDVQTGSQNVAGMLEELAKDNGILPVTDDEPADDQSGELQTRFDVLIECPDETSQTELLERLTAEGHKCRALIS